MSTTTETRSVEEPTAQPKPTPGPVIFQEIRYDFTENERLEQGKLLAKTFDLIGDLEEQKKQSASQFKSAIEEQEIIARRAVGLIKSGFEMRSTKCRVYYHDPMPGVKTIRREDDGEPVYDEPAPMEEWECQQVLDLGEPDEGEPDEDALPDGDLPDEDPAA